MKNYGDSELPPELSQATGSILIRPNRIDFWPFRLAGTLKRVLCAPRIFSYTRRDEFIGAHNDVKIFIADQGSLLTSVLVYDGTES